MKKLLIVVTCVPLAFSLVACGESNSSETSGEVVTQEPEKVEKTYESVLSDYTLQIQNAVPNLINEFNTEADASDGSIESLAEISNNKVQDLAKICNDGVSEMAEIMYDKGDEYEVYEEWANQLQNVYMDEANKIQDAYMSRASAY